MIDNAVPSSLSERLLQRVREQLLPRGCELAAAAMQAGLAVTAADGSQRAIPIGALPVLLDAAEIARRTHLAAKLVAATAKAARWRMQQHPAEVLAALSPAERRWVKATWQRPAQLPVGRVDFLLDRAPVTLEVNTTIPAMQGYSDIAAASWLRIAGAGRPDLDQLIAANGSNSDALLAALQARHAELRAEPLRHIALLCRRGDAQISELAHLQRRFAAAGLDAAIVHPDQLAFREGWACSHGRRWQLVYRHLFISRLDRQPSAAVNAALAQRDRGSLVLNPPTPHWEMKSTLGWLSQAGAEPALAAAIGLDADEQQAIADSVPWTRPLRRVGAAAPEWLDAVIAQPDDFVLKRSWSYGGSEVFVGRAREHDDFIARARVALPGAHDWPALLRRALDDDRGGGFIVQRAVPRRESTQWLCTPQQVVEARVTTDYAAYASLGAQPAWSGVCRAAASDVVNIVGGGAVVPLLTRQVIERLLDPSTD